MQIETKNIQTLTRDLLIALEATIIVSYEIDADVDSCLASTFNHLDELLTMSTETIDAELSELENHINGVYDDIDNRLITLHSHILSLSELYEAAGESLTTDIDTTLYEEIIQLTK